MMLNRRSQRSGLKSFQFAAFAIFCSNCVAGERASHSFDETACARKTPQRVSRAAGFVFAGEVSQSLFKETPAQLPKS